MGHGSAHGENVLSGTQVARNRAIQQATVYRVNKNSPSEKEGQAGVLGTLPTPLILGVIREG